MHAPGWPAWHGQAEDGVGRPQGHGLLPHRERGPAPPCLHSPIGFRLHLCFPPLPPLKGPNPWFMTLGGGTLQNPITPTVCEESITPTVCWECSRGPASCSHGSRPSLSPVPPLGLCTRPSPCWCAPSPGPPPSVRTSLLTSPILCSLGTPSSQTRSGPASVLRGPESLHRGIWLASWGTGRVCSACRCVCGP